MILWWIGDAILLVAVIPVVVYLLKGVLDAATSIVPSVVSGDLVAGLMQRLDGVRPFLHGEAVDVDGRAHLVALKHFS